MADEYIQVYTTTGSKEDAEKIAKLLVEQMLAGCVQVVGPISSTYWWEENIEAAQEWLCIIKTKRILFEKLSAAIQVVHPYRVPEVTAVPIVAGSKDYLDWLQSVLTKMK